MINNTFNLRKLKAFTLIELIVTMLLSVFVFSLIFWAYSSSVKNYLLYNEFNTELLSISEMQFALEQDFHRAQYVQPAENGIYIYTKTKQGDAPIHYSFEPDNIKRKTSAKIDTFFFENENLQILFNDRHQFDQNGLVDKISFLVKKGDKEFPFSYSMWYDRTTLFEEKLR